jgi:hypothetical protein
MKLNRGKRKNKILASIKKIIHAQEENSQES